MYESRLIKGRKLGIIHFLRLESIGQNTMFSVPVGELFSFVGMNMDAICVKNINGFGALCKASSAVEKIHVAT